MLLRVVLFLGVGLVLAAFGAAGWQYYQGLPATSAAPAAVAAADVEVIEEAPAEDADAAAEATDTAEADMAEAEDVADPGQSWMISDSGGLVSRRVARNYLAQDKFVKDRTLNFSLRLPLTQLLSAGEALPADPYRQAFAEVRAAGAAAGFCEIMQAAWAKECRVTSADLQKESYDPATMTAMFRVEIAFTLKPAAEPLPDLGTRALSQAVWQVQLPKTDTPQQLLANAVDGVAYACIAGSHCRVMGMNLVWEDKSRAHGNVTFGALMPLPKGVFPAPSLY